MKKMRSLTSKHLAVMPNAGFPKFVNGRYVYHSTPEYFGVLSGNFADIGVRIIGGCCGTTPEHIHAISTNLNKKFPKSIEINDREERNKQLDNQSLVSNRSELYEKLSTNKFVISAEVSPPKGINPDKVLAGAKMLKDSGCDSINVADSPMARLRMDCKSMAHLIEHQVGIETIIHFTSRDRNLMGLQADLLGAYALGIRNVLSVTGDPPSMGDYPNASARI
jgi:methionine synthase / methylenetetrahydrofolate reductase(NADPH)